MKSLSRHIEDVKEIVVGQVLIGEHGQIDVLYGARYGDRIDQISAMQADTSRLRDAGYRSRIIGRSRGVAIFLQNVGTAIDARYVK